MKMLHAVIDSGKHLFPWAFMTKSASRGLHIALASSSSGVVPAPGSSAAMRPPFIT